MSETRLTGLSARHRQVLLDEELDRRLRTDGWVIVPFLDPGEVDELAEACAELRGPDDSGFTIDFLQEDRGRLHRTAEVMAPIWARHLPAVFAGYAPVVASFLVKFPGEGGELPLHHEITYAEPDLYPTYNIWIPLVDVDREHDNGVLELIPGTEDLPTGMTGWNSMVEFRPYEVHLRAKTVPLDVPAGWAAVYDSRMLHGSGCNNSTEPRPAVGSLLYPDDAPLINVVATGRRNRRVYAVDAAFYVDVHLEAVGDEIDERGYELLREFEDQRTLTPEDFAAVLQTDADLTPRPVVAPGLIDPDLVDGLEVMAELPLPGAELCEHDIGLGAGDIEDQGVAGLGLEEVSRDGEVAFAPLDAAGVPPEVRSVAPPGKDATVLILDRESCVVVRAVDGRGIDVGVYECPTVRAGIFSDTAFAEFQLAKGVSAPGSGPFTLWNDGPGSAWVVISRPGRLRLAARSLRRGRGTD